MPKSTYKMNKITYLFGAGASKHALPIVNEIPDRLIKLIQLLNSKELKLDDEITFKDLKGAPNKTDFEYQNELIETLQWMHDESKNHASIDTFAKKLFIKGEKNKLKHLKIAMSIFFIFEQVLNKPDYRYDSFYSAILNNLSSFPKNINIMSWNYDYQFELALAAYTNNFELYHNQSILRVQSKYGDNSETEGFGILKLNGTTGMNDLSRPFQSYQYIDNLHVKVDKEFFKLITRNFVAAKYLNNIKPTLSFAWEEEHTSFNRPTIVESAIQRSSDSVALVIIGYSFPFFNREIDRKIIGNMKNLKRVYVQSLEAETIIERFKAIRDDLSGIEIVPKYDLGQFVLPNEL